MDKLGNVRLTAAAAAVLWVSSLAVILTAFGSHDPHLGRVGVVLSLAAVMATIRMCLIQLWRMMLNAFELGRDAAEFEATVWRKE